MVDFPANHVSFRQFSRGIILFRIQFRGHINQHHFWYLPRQITRILKHERLGAFGGFPYVGPPFRVTSAKSFPTISIYRIFLDPKILCKISKKRQQCVPFKYHPTKLTQYSTTLARKVNRLTASNLSVLTLKTGMYGFRIHNL